MEGHVKKRIHTLVRLTYLEIEETLGPQSTLGLGLQNPRLFLFFFGSQAKPQGGMVNNDPRVCF